VFAGLGYEQCDDSSVEAGCQKVALYETQDVWTHAATQMPNGAWRSKMGEGPVIEHQAGGRAVDAARRVYAKGYGCN
jgi:hypothetical protein